MLYSLLKNSFCSSNHHIGVHFFYLLVYGHKLSIVLITSNFFSNLGLSLTNQVLEIRPSPLDGYKSDRGSRDSISCDRVHVIGITRLKLRSYASSTRLTLAPSVVIPEKLHSKIQICLHR